MGTNFYLRGRRGDDSPEGHIGKRSAAGRYCWDCGVTLHRLGADSIHKSDHGEEAWHSCCPRCGTEPDGDDLAQSSAGRELGFNDSEPRQKSGVRSCSSFTWAFEPGELRTKIHNNSTCHACGRRWNDDLEVIEDEYGHLFSLREFEAVLLECPIQHRAMIGKEFS